MRSLSKIVLLILLACNANAQSVEQERSVKPKGELITIHWRAQVSERVLEDAAKNLSLKYPEKIISAALDSRQKGLIVVFKSAILTNEDLLQIIQMEGVVNPYFILQQRKYFLNASGSMVFDFIK